MSIKSYATGSLAFTELCNQVRGMNGSPTAQISISRKTNGKLAGYSDVSRWRRFGTNWQPVGTGYRQLNKSMRNCLPHRCNMAFVTPGDS